MAPCRPSGDVDEGSHNTENVTVKTESKGSHKLSRDIVVHSKEKSLNWRRRKKKKKKKGPNVQ